MSTRAENLRPGDVWQEGYRAVPRLVRMISSRPGVVASSIIIEVEDTETGERHELHLYRVNRRELLPR